MLFSDDPHGQAAARLVASLALAEPRMRELAAERVLERMIDEDVVLLLAALQRGSSSSARVSDALAVVLGALQKSFTPERKNALAEVARERGETLLASLVSGPETQKIYRESDEQFFDPAVASKTLGHRKTLARQHDKDMLARLAQDQDASVVHNVLANALTTEAQVVRMAARRPARAEVLVEIYQSPRWNTSRAVRRALALNPYTPVEVALQVVSLLLTQDLSDVASNRNLHPSVRLAALERKRSRRGSE